MFLNIFIIINNSKIISKEINKIHFEIKCDKKWILYHFLHIDNDINNFFFLNIILNLKVGNADLKTKYLTKILIDCASYIISTDDN